MATKPKSTPLKIPQWLRQWLRPWKITVLSIVLSELLYGYFYWIELYKYPTGWYGFVISFFIPLVVALPISFFVIRLLNFADAARTELEVESEIRSRLLGVLSHDVRSPLAGLSSILDLLLEKDIEPQQAETLFKELKAQLNFTRDTLDRISLWAKMKIKDSGNALEEVKLDLLKSTVEEYARRFAESYGVNVEMDWAAGLKVISDEDVVIIALTNLSNNAVKYSPKNGTVTIGAKQQGDRVVLTVTDEGRGLPTEDLDELLSPTKGEYLINTDSMGIGLFLAREFVQLSDGFLEARNIPGKGAQFSITLPSSNGK